jgi:hypothetical protein
MVSMDAKMRSMMIRAKTPRTIALIACFGTAAAIGGCGGSTETPASPVLRGVLDGSCAELPPSTPGGFPLLPNEAVRLRVAAAWPSADLVVKANGAELEKVGPSDTGRQSDLKAAGNAYWVPENIDPNPTPPAWTVHVELPQSMRAGPLTLELTSRTPGGASSSPLTVNFIEGDIKAEATAWNRVKLDWRDRGDELGYLLERREEGGPYTGLVSIGRDASGYIDTQVRGKREYTYRVTAQGCGAPAGPRTGFSKSTVDVTTPKQTGVDTITLSRSPDPADDQFVRTNPLNIFLPEDAVVTSVTNVSTDENDNGVKLELVRHTDANGVTRSLPAATCPTAPLEPQASTSAFDGQTVEGEWRARAVCISATFLDPPALIALRIAWTQ